MNDLVMEYYEYSNKRFVNYYKKLFFKIYFSVF